MSFQTGIKRILHQRSGGHEVLGALIFYSVMALVMTWPLAERMSHAIVGEIGDNIYFVWMIGWMQKAIFELGVNPFDVWFLNYPEGWSMAYTEITPAQLALALPFSFIGGSTFAYNAAMLSSFVLSGLGMYLWVRHLTDSSAAGLVAGMIFAFLPYRFAHFLIGHLNLSGTQWFPFYFMGFFDILLKRGAEGRGRLSWKPVLLAGISLGLIGLTSQYYLYMVLLLSGLIVFVYLLQRKDDVQVKTTWGDKLPVWMRRFLDGGLWKHLLGMGLISAPLVLLASAPYILLAGEGGLPDRGISIVRKYSASPTDFLLPSTDHFLFGQWVWEHFNRDLWIEGTLYIGIVAASLAILAWVRRKESGQVALQRLFLWGGIFALVLAMGTDLHWNAQSVEIPAPGFLAGLIGRDRIPILLPGYVLFYYFPLYAKLRALMRFGIFVLVFSSAAAGLGSAWLFRQVSGGRRMGLLLLILGLVFLDFYPGTYTEFDEISPRPVDYWLSQQPGDGAMVQMPFSLAEDQEHTYYTLTHGKAYIGGFFNAFPPEQYTRILPLLATFPDVDSVDLIRELGVQYVLVDQDEYADAERLRWDCDALGLQFLVRIEDQQVYELKP